MVVFNLLCSSNPDWCQLSILIPFAPHPFCAAIILHPLVFNCHPKCYTSPSPIPSTAPPGFQTQCLLKFQRVPPSSASARTTASPHFFVLPLYLPIVFVTYSLSLSFFFRPQITTSLRVWSVVGVPRWCWVKVESFMRRERSRFSKAPGDLSLANSSQTTLISAWNAGTR